MGGKLRMKVEKIYRRVTDGVCMACNGACSPIPSANCAKRKLQTAKQYYTQGRF